MKVELVRNTLSATDAAAYCSMSIKTFNKARRLGNGPAAFNAHGGRTRFAKAALDKWLSERSDIDPLAPKGAA